MLLAHTQLDRNLELFDEEKHTGIIYAAAMEGVDVSPVVGGSKRYIAFGETKHGYGPGCILDIVGTNYVAEPHVTWFPWTTASQRYRHFKWAMEELAKDRQVFLTVEKEQMAFFEHFVKKGILRKVGYIENLAIVDEIHMYQYNKETKDE